MIICSNKPFIVFLTLTNSLDCWGWDWFWIGIVINCWIWVVNFGCWLLRNIIVQVEFVGRFLFVLEECTILVKVVGIAFSVIFCKLCIPYNLQDGFLRKVHTSHSEILFFVNMLQWCGSLRIWRIVILNCKSFWCAHISGVLCTGLFLDCALAAEIYFCIVIEIPHCRYVCCLRRVSI